MKITLEGKDNMKPIIVLETHGKHESVDTAKVHLFDSQEKALSFCKEKSTGRRKYWNNAEIVADGVEIELMQPKDETSH